MPTWKVMYVRLRFDDGCPSLWWVFCKNTGVYGGLLHMTCLLMCNNCCWTLGTVLVFLFLISRKLLSDYTLTSKKFVCCLTGALLSHAV